MPRLCLGMRATHFPCSPFRQSLSSQPGFFFTLLPMVRGQSFALDDPQLRRRAILASVIVGAALLVIKLSAAALTGSAAILSDALESIINVVASLFALYSVIL